MDIKRGLFSGFPYRCLLQRFTIVDESSWDSPSRRRVFPLDQHDSLPPVFSIDFNDDIHCGNRIPVSFHPFSRGISKGAVLFFDGIRDQMRKAALMELSPIINL
jgi:hypothetical protein